MSAHARLTIAGAVATLLAALSLGSVYSRGTWVWHVLFVVVTVVAAGALGRRVGLPRALVPLTSLAALLLYLTVAFVSEHAWLGVLPTPDAVRAFAALVSDGLLDVQRTAAPVEVLPGLLVLTVIGVGAVAIVVDTAAVTYRRAALAGVPLLVLYAVPASISPSGVGWISFAVGGLGYLGLLLVDSQDRVSRWGRAARRSRGESTELVQTGQLLPVARRVGVTAVALGVVVPLLLPGIDEGLLPWTSGTGPGHGRGTNRVTVENPILDLRKDLVTPGGEQVLEYTTDDPEPAYLRVVTLDEFDGNVWKPSRLQVPNSQNVAQGLPQPVGLSPSVPRTQVRTTVSVNDLKEAWLPLPYPATKVDIDGLWLYDVATFNVFSTRDDTQGIRYSVTSLEVQPTPAMLRDAGRAPSSVESYLQLPADLPESVRSIARQVVAGAATDYDKALDLQNWLRDPSRFTYDTSAPDGTGTSAIEAFLARRSGFCVHFASTMAVMARTLGIPARVDVGFTRGHALGGGTWSVTMRDAHAWPELYFEGVGWVPFEPTPAVRTGEPPAYARGGTGTTPDVLPTPGASASPTGSARSRINDPNAPENSAERKQRAEDRAAAAAGGGGGPDVPWGALAVVAAVALGCATPALGRLLVRRRRLAGRADTASWARDVWRELRDSARDLDYAWPPSQTPRQAASRIARDGHLRGEARAALERLGLAAERAHYAASVGPVDDLVGDFRAVMGSLSARRSRATRLRARLLPTTLRDLLRGQGERGATRVDEVRTSVRRRLPLRAGR